MKYNDLQNISPKRKRNVLAFILIISFCFTVIVFIKWLIPLTSKFFENLNSGEIIAILAIIATILTFYIQLGKYLLDMQVATKKSIDINIKVEKTKAVIKCTIENNGQRRITPQNVFVFIEEGILSDRVYKFPFLLKHEKGECDCNLSKRCKAGDIKTFPKELLNEGEQKVFRKVVKYRHLSSEAIMYIDPGEIFNDSVVFELNPGVYRAIIIATAVKEDCMCTTENFIIL